MKWSDNQISPALRSSRTTNRIKVGDRNLGLSLAQAIILAEFGDTIVVRTEEEKGDGEQLARRIKPNTKIDFIVEPVSHLQ